MMQKSPLSRRGFMRLALLTTGSAVAAACQKALTGTVTPAPSLAPSVRLRLAGGNRDVWTWVKPVQVEVLEEACESLTFSVHGKDYPALVQGPAFTAEIPLMEGANPITAVCVLPGGAAVKSDPVIYTGRLRQAPRAVIEISVQGGRIVLDGSQSLPGAMTGTAIEEFSWSAREGNPEGLQLESGGLAGELANEQLTLLPPAADGEYYVRLRVVDGDGREDTATSYFVVEDGLARVPDYDHENPAWLKTAVVYGVVPFLFGSPAFQAIGERLDELADLGINAIWLGPINAHPPDDYGYAVEDYFGLDPAYGTEEDFRALVQAAHGRGIRVLMDFVPNHTSDTHPYFRDAQQRGPESPYWDFYDRDAEGNYTYYFEWSHLPNLNFDHPEVRQMMIEAFSYWVREFDVDGFRVDVVWGVRERRPEFWLDWRRELKRIKPDLMLLAEATARDPYYFDNGFDVAYDWTHQPGGWAWKVAWDAYKYRLLSYNLTYALTNRPEGFHPDALIFRFLNNNDTGERFITRHGEGVTRVATAMLLTLPGIPLIYTGDEYGLEFEPYQQLEPLEFEERVPGLRAYHQSLIELRTSIPSLHSRHLSLITPDAVPQTVFSYVRYGEPGEMPVLVLLNFSEEAATFAFEVPAEFGDSAVDSLYDLLAGEGVPALESGRMSIHVPALSARILAESPAE